MSYTQTIEQVYGGKWIKYRGPVEPLRGFIPAAQKETFNVTKTSTWGGPGSTTKHTFMSGEEKERLSGRIKKELAAKEITMDNIKEDQDRRRL